MAGKQWISRLGSREGEVVEEEREADARGEPLVAPMVDPDPTPGSGP